MRERQKNPTCNCSKTERQHVKTWEQKSADHSQNQINCILRGSDLMCLIFKMFATRCHCLHCEFVGAAHIDHKCYIQFEWVSAIFRSDYQDVHSVHGRGGEVTKGLIISNQWSFGESSTKEIWSISFTLSCHCIPATALCPSCFLSHPANQTPFSPVKIWPLPSFSF